MQNLFVNENDEFTINFTVCSDEYGTIFCDVSRELLMESLKRMGKDKVEEYDINDYKAIFKKPSFGDTMTLYNTIFKVSDEVDIDLNPVLARYNKIAALIKRWDLKGKEEKPTEDDIKKLHPIIANAIGIQIDAEMGGILS